MAHSAQRYQRNITALNWFSFLRFFAFWQPIDQFFVNEIGGDEFTISLGYAAWALAIIAAEVPSGYLADRLGRKTAFYFGQYARISGYLLIVAFQSIPAYLVALFLFGLAMAAPSGADSALLYETLDKLGQVSQYKKHAGRMKAFAIAGIVAASPITVVLSFLPSYVYNYGLSIVPQLAVLFLIKAMVEPPQSKNKPKENSFLATKKVFRLVTKQRLLVFLIALVGVVELIKRSGMELGLSLLEQAVGTQQFVIVIWTFGAFSRAFSSWVAHKIALSGQTLAFFSVCLFAAMSFSPDFLMPLFYIMMFMPVQLAIIENEDLIQRVAPPELRATTISSVNFVLQIFVTLPMLAMGAFAARVDVRLMFQYSAVLLFVFVITALLGLHIFQLRKEGKT